MRRNGRLGPLLHPHKVGDLGDHPTDGRGVLELGAAADAVQAQANEGRALVLGPADRAAGLNDGKLLGHQSDPQASTASVEAPSARRPRMSPTFLPRLEAIWR